MGRINLSRVLLGGLVAGLIMNVSQIVLHAIVLGADGAALLAEWSRIGLQAAFTPGLLVWLVAVTLLLGVLAVWTNAAIRPRFGPGARTALIAGIAVWAMSYLYAGVYLHAGVVIMPPKLTWTPVAWSLVELPVATLVGAWLYRE